MLENQSNLGIGSGLLLRENIWHVSADPGIRKKTDHSKRDAKVENSQTKQFSAVSALACEMWMLRSQNQ